MEKHIICNQQSAKLFCAMVILSSASASAQAAIVINEVDYDQPGGDVSEFVELFNPDNSQVLLDGYTLDLINGNSGDAYSSFDLSGLSIAANGYLVLCGTGQAVANCTTGIASGSWLQNGGSNGDAVALLSAGAVIDSLVYENIGSHLGRYAEGHSAAPGDSNSVVMSIARLPNGVDSNDNASDFDAACLTPGSANVAGSGDCTVSLNPVPLPAAVWLFGSGLLGLIGISRCHTNT